MRLKAPTFVEVVDTRVMRRAASFNRRFCGPYSEHAHIPFETDAHAKVQGLEGGDGAP